VNTSAVMVWTTQNSVSFGSIFTTFINCEFYPLSPGSVFMHLARWTFLLWVCGESVSD